jgi:anaerobic magnesium-protoporphyrin IX monomethyl ester cyclase
MDWVEKKFTCQHFFYSLPWYMMNTQIKSSLDVLLVGYENQENLGLRSILSYLQANGMRAMIAPFYAGQEDRILKIARKLHPRMIGFSLIFQYSLEEFGSLMRHLRAHGLGMHFTAGGHYPSLRPEQTFEMLPDLNTIVRFEGEETLLELLQQLEQPQLWHTISGLAYHNGSGIEINPVRPLIEDLDSLPRIHRDEPRQAGGGIKIAYMLASRGCLFNCSFCSIRQFYGSVGGELRRIRSPQAVVDEMLSLYYEKGIKFFSFQDDDFAARTPRQKEWLNLFLQHLSDAHLSDQIHWKISCRVDDLEPDILKRMQGNGLLAVYLGVESGNERGLSTLNKHVSVEQNLAAIELLKEFGLAMSIGFMLLDPSSTMDSVRENINFLKTVGHDGYFPINFCKMLPYAGTPIEERLIREGRLKGSITQPDYGFPDPKLEWFEVLIKQIFGTRNFNPDGLVSLLQQADFDHRLTLAFENESNTKNNFGIKLGNLISQSNLLAIETLETLLDIVTNFDIEYLLKEQNTLVNIAEKEWRGEAEIEIELKKLEQYSPS